MRAASMCMSPRAWRSAYVCIDHHVISQIRPGYVNGTGGAVFAFYYDPCMACGNLINSVYYREYLQSDRDSTSALQKVSKIVSSSTDFQQLAGCASAQFSAIWAFEVTWIEAGDYYRSQIGSGSGDTGFSTVRTVLLYTADSWYPVSICFLTFIFWLSFSLQTMVKMEIGAMISSAAIASEHT